MSVSTAEQIKVLLGQVVQQGHDDQRQVTFADVVSALKKGTKDKTLRKKFGIRKKRTVEKLHVMFAHYKNLQKQAKNLPRKGLRVMFDENVGSMGMMQAGRAFGDVTSVQFEAIASALDPQVWAYAVEQKIDLIVTRDKRVRDDGDLTYIAMQAWHGARDTGAVLPMLLHVNSDIGTKSKAFAKSVKRSLPEIFALRAAQVGPSLSISKGGVAVRISRNDVDEWAQRQTQKVTKDYRHVRREKILALRFLRIELNAPAKADEDPELRMRRIKRDVTRKVAITCRARAVNDAIVRPFSPAARRAVRRMDQLAAT